MAKRNKIIYWWDGLIILAFFILIMSLSFAEEAHRSWMFNPVGSIVVIWVIIIAVRLIFRKIKEAHNKNKG